MPESPDDPQEITGQDLGDSTSPALALMTMWQLLVEELIRAGSIDASRLTASMYKAAKDPDLFLPAGARLLIKGAAGLVFTKSLPHDDGK